MTAISPVSLRAQWPLCEGLALRAPIIQAPLGECDGPLLAGAVSRAGGMGCLSLFAPEPAVARRRLARLRQITRRPVLAAFTAPLEAPAVLDICVEAGIRHFQVFWWNGPRLAPRIRAAGAKVFWQVSTVEQARDALDLGADVLIAQGTEAGGPVRGPHPVKELIGLIREAVGDLVPLVAAGGLADRSDVAEVLAAGAKAAMLGTRFLLSEEAWTAPRYQALLLRASEDDLILDTRLLGSWPCAARRMLIPATGEDVPDLFAGKGVGRIHSLLPAAEIVRRLTPGR